MEHRRSIPWVLSAAAADALEGGQVDLTAWAGFASARALLLRRALRQVEVTFLAAATEREQRRDRSGGE
jgi:hypothetical protein